MAAAVHLAAIVGAAAASRALGVDRSGVYRRRQPPRPSAPRAPRPAPKSALPEAERRHVLDVLHSERFIDKTPHEVVPTLLDEGVYIGSVRTLYRVLGAAGEVRERRDQARHPEYAKPELLATRPNEIWSWDITKLRGPIKWTYFYLYVILDIFSRYVVGWVLACGESAAVAKALIDETVAKQRVDAGRLTIHADRGAAMKSKAVAELLVDLGVERSHSRPHVSDDNPYSEAQFKTLKYAPGFPDRFGSEQDARLFCRAFFSWYNAQHRHSGIAFLTPEMVHYGRASDVLARRQLVLEAAYEAHPERFINGPPRPRELPRAVWINKPSSESKVITLDSDARPIAAIESPDAKVITLDIASDQGALAAH